MVQEIHCHYTICRIQAICNAFDTGRSGFLMLVKNSQIHQLYKDERLKGNGYNEALAVAHREFAGFDVERINRFFGDGEKILLDVRGILNRNEFEAAGYNYWRL